MHRLAHSIPFLCQEQASHGKHGHAFYDPTCNVRPSWLAWIGGYTEEAATATVDQETHGTPLVRFLWSD